MRPSNSKSAKEHGDVLVVDDTLANLRLLINLLSVHGYNVRPAQSGALALAAVKAAPPDIVLLDINMPEMNGYEVCEKLKEDEKTRDIPVIFISALSDTDSKLQAFTAGGVDYISKPFQLEEVLARIKTHLTIRRLRAGLEERNRDLAAFDRSVAHDLRSPLTALLGLAELMKLDAVQRTDENVETVWDAAKHMQSIIESLLLFAQIGNAQAEITPIAMGPLVGKVVKSLQHEIQRRQGVVTIEEGDWPSVEGHAPWVEQVWANYISNALKYGGRPPRVHLSWDMGNSGDPRFSVHDNGPGLDPGQRAKVFSEFERLKHPNGEDGHGLGLSIVRRIVEKLAGKVGLESQPGQGSRFFFTLKAAANVESTREPASRTAGTPGMVLPS